MRLRKLGCLVVVALGLTGCGSALQGAGVVGNETNAQSGGAAVGVVSIRQTKQFGGPGNLLRNGSFEQGVTPWVPFTGSKLALTKSVHRFGRLALLARPGTKPATSLGAAIVDLVSRPSHGSRYSLSAWVKGSLRHALVTVQLAALPPHHTTWVRVGRPAVQPVTGRWQHLSMRGTVGIRNAAYLRATVSIKNITPDAWLAIDGVQARILSAGSGK